MKTIIFTALLLFTAPAIAVDGMVNVSSAFSVAESANRMARILNEKGMIIFKRIDFSAAAEKIDIELQNSELIIFGNPKIGSLLMQCQPSVAIDLPLKALIWKDNTGKVWISYNDPAYLEKRHHLSGCETVIAKMKNALISITTSATTE